MVCYTSAACTLSYWSATVIQTSLSGRNSGQDATSLAETLHLDVCHASVMGHKVAPLELSYSSAATLWQQRCGLCEQTLALSRQIVD